MLQASLITDLNALDIGDDVASLAMLPTDVVERVLDLANFSCANVRPGFALACCCKSLLVATQQALARCKPQRKDFVSLAMRLGTWPARLAANSPGPMDAEHIDLRPHPDMTLIARVAEAGALRNFTKLFLGRNPGLGDAGVVLLANRLRFFPQLEWLALEGCGFGNPGALALAAAGPMPNLVTLHIHANVIGDDGMYALASSIASGYWPKLAIEVGKNKSKRKLEIWQNDGICSADAHRAVVDAVQKIEMDARALKPIA